MARGYSLLELVVALAIIALIAAVAAPVIVGSLDRMTLTSDARAIATHVRALRETALDEQKEIVVTAGDLPLSAGTEIEIPAKKLIIASDGTAGARLHLSRNGSAVDVVINRLTGRITIEDAP